MKCLAIFRQIHVSFWQDSFVLELPPEEKYFYLYLMTNSKTNQIGIYEISKKIMEIESGYSIDRVSILLKKFVEHKKILYSEATNELMLLNWCKYNWSSSPKVVSLVNKELKTVKNVELSRLYVKQLQECGYAIDRLSIEYLYSMDTESQEELEEELELEEEKEVEVEQKENAAAPPNDKIFQVYEDCYGIINGTITESLLTWINDLSDELVIEAIQRSYKQGKNFRYAEGIMRNWASKKYTTMDQVLADDTRHEQNSKPAYQRSGRKEVLPDWLDKEPEEITTKPVDPNLNQQVEEIKRKLREEREHVSSRE